MRRPSGRRNGGDDRIRVRPGGSAYRFNPKVRRITFLITVAAVRLTERSSSLTIMPPMPWF